MKSGLMVSWAERCFSLAAARLAVLLLILGAAGSVQAIVLIVATDGSGAGTVASIPAGTINCGGAEIDCFEDLVAGSTVTLRAKPGEESTFDKWTGACSGTGLCVVTMDSGSTKTVTATFKGPTLYVAKTGMGTGVVTSVPDGINCGAVCAYSYNTVTQLTSATTVTLTATPDAGSSFSGWSGACSGTGTCVVTMSTARNVTATFNSVTTSSKKTLYVYKLGSGKGAVTSDPSGIDCPSASASCASASYDIGTTVALTATSAQGSSFTGWSGGGTSVAVNSVQVNGAAKTVTLTLAAAVTSGQSIMMAYTDPTSGNDGNAIQDVFGNDAASVPVNSVTNLTGVTQDTTPPKFTSAIVNGNMLEISYVDADNNLDAINLPPLPPYGSAPTLPTPDTRTFIVKVDGSDRTINKVEVDSTAKKVTLTLATTVAAGQNVTLSYTDPTSSNDPNAIQDSSGNDAVTLLETSVTNLTGTSGDAIPPKFALATVNGNKLVLHYIGPANLNEANVPAVGAFAVQVGGVNGCVGSAASCQVTMDTAKTVTATFDGVSPTFFTIHVSKMGEGKGTIKSSVASSLDPIDCDLADKDCDGSFSLGTPVVLKAVAESGSKFASWTGCTNTPSSTEDCYVLKTLKDVEVDGTSYGVTATFTKAASAVRTLWITKQGAGTGSITSTSSPLVTGQQEINCGGTCSVNYNPGTTVTLRASPGAPAFTGWKGACTGTLTTCTFTMESGKSVIATFIPSVTASLTGTGRGVVTSQPAGINCGSSCTAIFASGSSAILTATPNTGSLFAGWAGPCTGTAAACTVGTSVTQSVTAMFSLANAAPAKPGAPLIAAAKPGPGSAAISFTPPASEGSSPVIRYDASCQATGLSSATASGTVSPIVVRKLSPRRSYACTVSAVNSVGASSPSAALSVTPSSNSVNSIFQLLLD